MTTAGAWQVEIAGPHLAARLAQLHADALPHDFLPSLGRDFLGSVYYPAALRSPHGVTLAATVAGHPLGCVTVAHDADRFTGSVIRQNLISLSFYVARAVLRRPRTLIEAMGIAWQTVTAPADDVGGEIVFIAVDASQRGGGIGTALVRSALEYLGERQVVRCRTKTLASNDGVIEMYRRLGWHVRERFWLIGREYATIVSPPIVGRDASVPRPGSI